MSRVPAVVHVDVDGLTDIFRSHGWAPPPTDPVFETGMRSLLELFEEAGVAATFFVVADSLDDPAKRAVLRDVIAAGHEIASHTTSHALLLRSTPGAKRAEIFDSRKRLQDELGVPVDGFRAPGYQIDRQGVEFLEEAGYTWDSSAFPTPRFADRLDASVDSLTRPGRPFDGLSLSEVPLPDHRPAPVPANPSYALLLGSPFFRWGLRRSVSRGRPFVLLFHLIDVADPLPSHARKGWRQCVFTLSNRSAERKRALCRDMLESVTRTCDVVSTEELLRRA